MKSFLVARATFSRKSVAAWLTFSLLAGFTGHAAAQNELRVAVVDVAKLFKSYYKATEFDAKIDESNQTYQNDVDTRMEGHHRLVEELARIDKALDDPALAAPARADRQKQRASNLEQTQKLEQDLRDFKASRERAIQEMVVRERTQIVEDIMVVLNARVETKHYDMIFNKSGQGAGGKAMVLYANDSLDITDDVLATLNQNRPPARKRAPGNG